MPAELRDQVTAAAKANGRSLNSEIVTRLQDSFSKDRALAGDHEGILEWLSEVRTTLDHTLDQLIQQSVRSGDVNVCLENKKPAISAGS